LLKRNKQTRGECNIPKREKKKKKQRKTTKTQAKSKEGESMSVGGT